MSDDREITIGGKTHTLKPFKLRQLREIAKMGSALGDDAASDNDKADFGFRVLEMALENVEPAVDGKAEDLAFEPDELQDALTKTMGLAALKTKGNASGEATAPANGA